MTPTSSDEHLYATPLSARVRAATIGRLSMLAVVALGLLVSGGSLVDPAGTALLAWAVGGYLIVNLLVGAGLEPHRHTRRLVDVTLVADVAFASVLAAVTGGPFSPLLPALYLLVVGGTVLFGWWSGLRLSILATVGMLWVLTTLPSAGDEQFLGVLGVLDESAIAADASLIQTAAVVATIWLLAAGTAWLTSINERQLRRSNLELATLREVNADLEASLDATEISQAVVRGLVRDFGYRRAAVWIPDGAERLRLVAAAGFDAQKQEALSELTMLLSGYPVRNAVRDSAPRLVARHDPRPRALSRAFGPGTALVLAPLLSEGRLLGLLSAEVDKPIGRAPRLSNRDLRILTTLSAEASLMLDNARLHAELRDLSITDALTGLYNRGYFQERLAEESGRVARRASEGRPRPLSLVAVDLDHFKQVNDTHGHPTGDALLRDFARLTQEVLRATDLVYRYGGEEFAVILVDADAVEARQAAERLRAAIERTTFSTVDGEPLAITASFGIATGDGAGLTPEALVAAADDALYAAKRSGRNRVVHADDLAAPERVCSPGASNAIS